MFPEEIKFLKPGEKVKVFVSSGQKRYVFVSKIKDVTSDLLKVEGSYEEEISSSLSPGTKLRISLMSHFDTEKGLPVIDASIVRYNEVSVPLISFSVKEAKFGWEKRRKHFRYETVIPIRCRWKNGEEKSKWSVDISEGGVSVSPFSKDEIKMGDELELTLFILSTKETLIVKGKVVRLKEVDGKYQVAFEFVSINQASWNIIISYILELEQLQRKW
ncbi:MAG: PilZ domain-containing protein [bacterium]